MVLTTLLRFSVRNTKAADIPSLEAVINQHWKVNIDHHKEIANDDAIFLVAETIEETGSPDQVVGTALMWKTDWNKTGYPR